MQKKTGLVRIIRATGFSFEGLAFAFKSEVAFRQELLLFAVSCVVVLLINIGTLEKALLLSSVFLVLVVEILNTALEIVVERISSEQHLLSKRIKDLGSAAVFLSLLNASVVWAMILL
jgi:diacylglycerol kinase (ATP)